MTLTVYFNFKINSAIPNSVLDVRTSGYAQAIQGLHIQKSKLHRNNFGIIIKNCNDKEIIFIKGDIIAQLNFNLQNTIELYMLNRGLCPIICSNKNCYDKEPLFLIDTDYE